MPRSPGLPQRLLHVLALASVAACLHAVDGGAAARSAPAAARLAPAPRPADAVPVPPPAYGSALPAFALFGWVGPPRDSTTVERYGELAATGFNVVMFAQGERGTWADNRVRLDCSRPFGLGDVLLDNDLDSVYVDRPETWALADEIVARYRDDQAFLGYYLGDEPAAAAFPRLGEWFEMLRQRDPAHPGWNSLLPRGAFASAAAFEAYLEAYVAATHPAVLCNNQYDFGLDRDLGLLPENVAVMGKVARAHGLPFWGLVQLVEHWHFRAVTDGMLRWQAAQWLAGGARGLGYFTYWTPPPDPDYHWGTAMIDWTGERTPYYDMVCALDARLLPLGRTLAGLRFVGTRFAGSVPAGGEPFAPDTVLGALDGRATLGWFADAHGQVHLFVANADSMSAQTLWLTPSDGRAPYRFEDDGSGWVRLTLDGAGRLALTLPPGDFALLRFPARVRAVAGVADAPGSGPALRVFPNPAFGRARFELAGIPGRATLEILDLAGRRVWSRALPRGATAAAWGGERSDGSRADGGVYFVCLRTARGSVVHRLAWLGAR